MTQGKSLPVGLGDRQVNTQSQLTGAKIHKQKPLWEPVPRWKKLNYNGLEA